jgi:hypothetical protein
MGQIMVNAHGRQQLAEAVRLLREAESDKLEADKIEIEAFGYYQSGHITLGDLRAAIRRAAIAEMLFSGRAAVERNLRGLYGDPRPE